MNTVTLTLNGKTANISRDAVQRQLRLSHDAITKIDATAPNADLAHNRHSTAAEIGVADAQRAARRAQHVATAAACRAALEP